MIASPVLYTKDGPFLPPQFDVNELREKLHLPAPEIVPPIPGAGWKPLVSVYRSGSGLRDRGLCRVLI